LRFPVDQFYGCFLFAGDVTVNIFTSNDSNAAWNKSSGATSVVSEIDSLLQSMQGAAGLEVAVNQTRSQRILTRSQGSGAKQSADALTVLWITLRRISGATDVMALVFVILSDLKNIFMAQERVDFVVDATMFDENAVFEVKVPIYLRSICA
jgi:hypothetical protein